MFSTAWLAPPWAGPQSEAMPAAIHAKGFAPLELAMRTVEVDAVPAPVERGDPRAQFAQAQPAGVAQRLAPAHGRRQRRAGGARRAMGGLAHFHVDHPGPGRFDGLRLGQHIHGDEGCCPAAG